MAPTNNTLKEIDLRIRTLLLLTLKLNQCIESPKFTNQLECSLALIACNHIAILLVRKILKCYGIFFVF